MDDTVGKEIDGYQVLDVLGRGGMGIVYKAEDVALSRVIALKMIDPSLAHDEAFLRRFRAEARALARINSPYIVSVHALRQTARGLFIVMEYVDGGTIADLIGEVPVPWQKALTPIKQMLHAFDHAHSVGVVHRDIKPRNIMLTREGVVKVTDFGLAKLYQQNVEVTITKGIAGTLFYMSPEQVKGLQDLDHRSDIYSLGVTIYEMLAGQLPLDRSKGEFAVLKSIVEDTPPPPSRFVPELPDALVRIVMKSLEKDPARRYQNVREMLDDVEAFEAAMGATSEASSAIKPVRRLTGSPARRMPFLVGAVATLVVLCAAAAFVVYRAWYAGGPSVQLTVTTVPAGATVYLGNRVVGETPLRDITVADGPVAVQIRKAGFIPADTTLIPVAGRPLALNLQLEAEAADIRPAGGTITSTPGDAEVSINGRRVGRTPYTFEAPAPAHLSVLVEKEGFRSWTWEQEVVPGESYTISASLERIQRANPQLDPPEAPPSRAMGSLTVHADRQGYIEVDGKEVTAATPLSLEVGQHKVACGKAPHRFEAVVRVSADSPNAVTCYFSGKVNIVTTMADGTSTWASIWIDGQNRGLTPTELSLDPGTYRISVRREGFKMLEEERTLLLRPALERQTFPLSFRIVKE